MSESQRTVTRREILKRGAIVGGGVLWVTPVVQTLGMRPAMAAAVSGGQCGMTIAITSCEKNVDSTATDVTFKTCVSPGCPCNPLPNGHVVHLIVLTPGSGNRVTMGVVTGEPSCWEATFSFSVLSPPAEVYALCGKVGPSEEIDVATAESDHIHVTDTDFKKCLSVISETLG